MEEKEGGTSAHGAMIKMSTQGAREERKRERKNGGRTESNGTAE